MACTDLLRHVTEAGRLLAVTDAPLEDRLSQAIASLAVALLEPDKWEPETKLLQRADRLVDKFRERGVDQMTNTELREAAKELFDIHVNVDMLISRELVAS